MYIHIDIFKWKPGTSQEDINVALKEVEALQPRISGICEITTGENQSQYSEGYTHVVLVRGDDREAIEAYRSHPDHKIIAAKIETMEEQGIGVDFTSNE